VAADTLEVLRITVSGSVILEAHRIPQEYGDPAIAIDSATGRAATLSNEDARELADWLTRNTYGKDTEAHYN
jgi:hypothetical protein